MKTKNADQAGMMVLRTAKRVKKRTGKGIMSVMEIIYILKHQAQRTKVLAY